MKPFSVLFHDRACDRIRRRRRERRQARDAGIHLRVFFVTLSVSALITVAEGCGQLTQVDVEAEDRHVFFPVLRAVWHVDPKITPDDPKREEETPGAEQEQFDRSMQVALEFDFSGGQGDSTQDLDYQQVIDFDGTSFLGPGPVKSEFTLYIGTIAARLRWPVARTISFDGLFGMGLDRLDLELSKDARSARDTTTTIGPYLGARMNWQPSAVIGAYAQAFAYVGVLGISDSLFGIGSASHSGADLAATLTPVRNVTLFGGWRFLSYEEDRSGSDVELKMSGPIAGLRLDF